MKAISLFSGIGGLDLAAEQCLIDVVAMVEKDEWCRALLSKRFNAEIHSDIYNFSAKDYNSIDLVFGGFPCQPFSVAGSQKGEKDERYLWGEFLRVVEECNPEWVLGENVKGLLNCGIERIKSDLERQGYEVVITLCAASDFGAIHQRERVFILGHKAKGQTSDTSSNGCNGGKKCFGITQAYAGTKKGKNQTEYSERCGTLWPILFTGAVGEEWGTVPNIRRVGDGVSSKLDKARIKALGNAVVPLQAYPFFKFITKYPFLAHF